MLRETEAGLGQIAGHRYQTFAPAVLPETVVIKVGANPRQPLGGIAGPHQAPHLHLIPALQLARQQVSPQEAGSARNQNCLPWACCCGGGSGGDRWQAPVRCQLCFPAQIQHPLCPSLGIYQSL